MDSAEIESVEVAPSGELLLRAAPDPRGLYEYIYRTATGVRWDSARSAFVAPTPREWSYADWFGQILADAKSELGVTLVLSSATEWVNVAPKVRQEIEVVANGAAT